MININCTEKQYETIIQTLSTSTFDETTGKCFFEKDPKNCLLLLDSSATEHTCSDCLKRNIKRFEAKADIDKLASYALSELHDLSPYVDGGDERSNDLMDCGMADGEWGVWIRVLNLLGVKHNYKEIE